MSNKTKDTRNSDVLQQRVEYLEKENKHLKQFNGFIEEHHINTLNKKVRDLYHRLRHSKIVYKRYVKQDTFNNKMVKSIFESEIERIKQDYKDAEQKVTKEIEELLVKNFESKAQLILDLGICKRNIGNKDLIIQDLKDVIVEQKSKLVDYNNLSNKQNDRIGKLISDMQVIEFANKRQSEIIKELQLENKEVNKQSKFFEIACYIALSFAIGSLILNITYLIK